MNPLTLLSILDDAEFLKGLAAGGVALLIVLLARRRGLWFLAWAAAALVALVWANWTERYYLTRLWALPLAVAVILGAAAGLRDLGARAPDWAIGLTFGLWVLGVWGTVPETEGAVTLLGVSAALMPALWPLRVTTPGAAGGLFACAVLVLVASTDGVARHGAIVGALGAAGLLLVAPPLLWFRTQMGEAGAVKVSGWLLVGTQVVFVILSGRVAGRVSSALLALILWLITAMLVGAAWGKLEKLRAARQGESRGGPA